MANYSKRFLTEFFEIYKQHECLWKVNSPKYHNKQSRKKAMNTLVKKFKEIDEEANEALLRKKLHNYRTSYKRQLNLVKKSCKSGVGTEDIYKPKLWYFHLLSFLNDQDHVPRASVSNMSSDGEEEVQDADICSKPVFTDSVLLCGDCSVTTCSSTANTTSFGKKHRQIDDPQCKLSHTTHEKLKEPPNSPNRDRFDVFGEFIALKLKSLAPDQRIMAEKLVNDVFFEAECCNLNKNWKVVDGSSRQT